jgi:hypothetical protein
MSISIKYEYNYNELVISHIKMKVMDMDLLFGLIYEVIVSPILIFLVCFRDQLYNLRCLNHNADL